MRTFGRYGVEALVVAVVAIGTFTVARSGPGLYATFFDEARAGATITVGSLGVPPAPAPEPTASPTAAPSPSSTPGPEPTAAQSPG